MCCDSTVRWPKNLFVFRCMICRTINDLKSLEGGKPPSAIAPSCLETSHIDVGHSSVANFD